MSFAAFRAVTEARTGGRLPGGTVLLVGLAMAEHTNARGELRAGVRRLGDWSGVAKSATARHVAAIVDAGVYEMTATGSSHRPARYCLMSPVGDVEPVDNGLTTSPVADVTTSPDLENTGTSSSPTPNLSLMGPVYKPRASSDNGLTTPTEIPDRMAEVRRGLKRRPT